MPSTLRYLSSHVAPAGVIVAIVALWELAVDVLHVSPDKLPPPSAILHLIWTDRLIFADAISVTVFEAIVGLAFGIAFGVISGVAFANFRLLERIFLPYFVASQAVPIIAFGAIIIMWFGNGVASKAVIAFYLSFFPIAVNALAGMKSVGDGEIGLMRTFGASRWDILCKLQLPIALPAIFTAIRLGVGLALVGAIVGEWFGASRGLGVILLSAMFDYRVTQLWAAIVLTGLLGTALFGLVAFAQRRVAWWQTGS